MSAGMVRTVSAHHDRLAAAVAPLAGRVVSASEVKAAYAAAYPDRPADVQWVIASDHCSNMTNKGACGCAMTDRALLERVGHGRYRVLLPQVDPTSDPSSASAPAETINAPRQHAPQVPVPTPPVSPPMQRAEVKLVSPANRDGRSGWFKLALKLAVVAVTLIVGLAALIRGTR